MLIINNYILTLFKLNPLYDKNTAHVKKSFDLFLLYLYNRSFLVLGVLYERSCSTKGAAQLCTVGCFNFSTEIASNVQNTVSNKGLGRKCFEINKILEIIKFISSYVPITICPNYISYSIQTIF